MRMRLAERPARLARRRRTERPRPWLRWATVAAVAAGIGALALTLGAGAPQAIAVLDAEDATKVTHVPPGASAPRELDDRDIVNGSTLIVPPGVHVTARFLDDGTRVRLGIDTVARLAVTGGAKRIEIERGTLIADVPPQPAGCPLRVEARDALCTVLGTRFRLDASETGTRLTVAEGRVRLTRRDDGSEVVVSAGQTAHVGERTVLRSLRDMRDQTGSPAYAQAVAPLEEWAAVDQPELPRILTNARVLDVEKLGVGVLLGRARVLLRAPNPDGQSWDLLQIYDGAPGTESVLVAIDLGRGTTRTFALHSSSRYTHRGAATAPDGKLYWTSSRNRLPEINVYDPGRDELQLRALSLPEGMRDPGPMTVGTDGALYLGGRHADGGNAVCRIEPRSGEVTLFAPVEAGKGGLMRTIAADERYVYFDVGRTPWQLVAFDRNTRQSRVLDEAPPTNGFVGVQQERYGCVGKVNRSLRHNRNRRYWLYRGRAVPMEDEQHPWNEPDEVRPWVATPAEPELFLDGVEPGPGGEAELWYRATAGGGGRWRTVRYQAPVWPQKIGRVFELPDERILCTAGSQNILFTYDASVDNATFLGRHALTHYATVVADGTVYLSGSTHAPLYAYDPARPPTVGAERPTPTTPRMPPNGPAANPRFLGHQEEHSGCYKMYAATADANGRVFFAGRWDYNGSGGGLQWYDPATEEAGGFWKPLSNAQVSHMTVTGDARNVVLSTRKTTDRVLSKPPLPSGRLFIHDPLTGAPLRGIDPVPGAGRAGMLVAAGGARVLGWTEDPEAPDARSVLYGVDVDTGEVAFRRTIPVPMPVPIDSNQVEAFDFRLGPDGFVWTFFADGVLVRIDPSSTMVHVVGKVETPGRIAFVGRDLYLSHGTSPRRIRGLVHAGR